MVSSCSLCCNKKVLLRERKRHTACRVASARYAGGVGGGVPHPVMVGGYPIQSWWGGDPIQSWWGGYPIQSWWGGVPHPVMVVGGYPIQSWWWGPQVPPTIQIWPGGYPRYSPPSRPGMWYPPPTIQTWDGVPPPTIQTWDGVPPHTNGEQTDIPKYKYYLPLYYVRGR